MILRIVVVIIILTLILGAGTMLLIGEEIIETVNSYL